MGNPMRLFHNAIPSTNDYGVKGFRKRSKTEGLSREGLLTLYRYTMCTVRPWEAVGVAEFMLRRRFPLIFLVIWRGCTPSKASA